MKKLIVILILGSILSGCSASWYLKKAEKKCPECFERDTTINNNIIKKDTIIYIDSTFLIYLPTDTIRISIPFEDLNSLNTDTIKSNDGIINTEITVSDGAVHIMNNLDSAIIYRLQDSILIKDAIISNQKEVIIEQGITIEKERTLKERFKSAKKWLLYIIYGIVILICFGLILKFVRWIKK